MTTCQMSRSLLTYERFMLLPVVISFLLLLLACLTRTFGPRGRNVSRVIVGVGGAVLLVLWFVHYPNEPERSLYMLDDSVSRASLFVAVFSCLIMSLLERHPSTLSMTCWSAGLLGLAGIGAHPVLQWIALQGTVLALVFFGRGDVTGSIWKRHSSILLGSGLFAAGFALIAFAGLNSNWSLVGTVLFLCGIGGMLRWFPFPRAVMEPSDFDPVPAIIGHRVLPAFTAGVVCWRLSELFPFSDQQAYLFVVVALFSMLISSIRLLSEDLMSRRMTFAGLSTLSVLFIALFLQNWERINPLRDWAKSSNLPTGETLFVAILFTEALTLLLLLAGQRLLQPQCENADITETLSGVARKQPIKSIPMLLALGSLAGMPPLPGFWWRFGLLVACLLPHRQSTITAVNERDNGVTVLGIMLLLILVVYSLGHLRLLQRVLFEPAFRVRESRRYWFSISAAGLTTIAFLAVSVYPLSLNRLLSFPSDPVLKLKPSQLEPAEEDQSPAPKDGTGIPKMSEFRLPRQVPAS